MVNANRTGIGKYLDIITMQLCYKNVLKKELKTTKIRIILKTIGTRNRQQAYSSDFMMYFNMNNQFAYGFKLSISSN